MQWGEFPDAPCRSPLPRKSRLYLLLTAALLIQGSVAQIWNVHECPFTWDRLHLSYSILRHTVGVVHMPPSFVEYDRAGLMYCHLVPSVEQYIGAELVIFQARTDRIMGAAVSQASQCEWCQMPLLYQCPVNLNFNEGKNI